uniref:DJ-1/PfpI domain-containing protein n=1 Tax=candidate division WOR-3 bacterium TaxID=2052148 RepID=A0A7C4GCX5_UNCW3
MLKSTQVLILSGLLACSAGAKQRTNVLVFVPQSLFLDEDYEAVTSQLNRAGLRVVTASTDTTAAESMDGLLIKPEQSLATVDPADYAGLVLVGGSGAVLYWEDSLLHSRCRGFTDAGRLIAAIGLMPIALARAGLLTGRRATVFPDRRAIEMLKKAGAKVSLNDIVIDGNIMTASRTRAARALARHIARRLPR